MEGIGLILAILTTGKPRVFGAFAEDPYLRSCLCRTALSTPKAQHRPGMPPASLYGPRSTRIGQKAICVNKHMRPTKKLPGGQHRGPPSKAWYARFCKNRPFSAVVLSLLPRNPQTRAFYNLLGRFRAVSVGAQFGGDSLSRSGAVTRAIPGSA
jgi:hypothetical protein